MTSDLERMREVLQQTFLAREFDAWLSMLGPYSDLCEENGLDQEAWLARNVKHIKNDTAIILHNPAKQKGNPTIIGDWLGFPSRSMFISQRYSGHLRVSVNFNNGFHQYPPEDDSDVELWDVFDVLQPVKGE